ncbi:MAG: M20/M25/M40 family metallo-hydrolase [Ardenticatenaceae bacterium]|nr:M20/M25/M40 family metallo-hydrolase [Ardenticatenaceae bacterium]
MEERLDRIGRQIDRDLDRHIASIQAVIRQPSMSTTGGGGTGIREMAETLQAAFAALGCQESEVVETSGNPIVFGHYDAGAPKTLIIYFMYDTEAVLPEEEWISPPMEGNLVEVPPFGRCIVGRGAINTKGPMQAFLNTVQAIQVAGEKVPINLKFVAEGEEELGSGSLAGFIQANVDRLKADDLFFPMPTQQSTGRTAISLGSKRGVIFELECSGALWGRGPSRYAIHSGQGAIVDNPAWRLIEALNCLATDNGNRVLVEGFYDDVLAPDEEQEELLDRLAAIWDEAEFKERAGAASFIDGLTGRDALKRLMFEPILGIRGIYAGDTRVGDVTTSKAIVPHRAVCKMNVALVPNQNKADLAAKIRAHLDRHGYGDVEMRLRPGTTSEPGSWGRVSVNDEIVQALIRTYAHFGIEPEIWPRSAGGWPGHLFQKYLGTSFISGGVGHGGRAHSPNEYLVVEGHDKVRGLRDMEKSFARLLFEYAAPNAEARP